MLKVLSKVPQVEQELKDQLVMEVLPMKRVERLELKELLDLKVLKDPNLPFKDTRVQQDHKVLKV